MLLVQSAYKNLPRFKWGEIALIIILDKDQGAPVTEYDGAADGQRLKGSSC